MRIEKNINLGIISWSNTKFSEQYMNCMVDSKENYKFDLGVRQIDSMLPYVCSLIDLRWGQNVVRTKKCHMKSRHVNVWLTFLSHFDILCDPFLFLPTVTWNLFNLYDKKAKCCLWWYHRGICQNCLNNVLYTYMYILEG